MIDDRTYSERMEEVSRLIAKATKEIERSSREVATSWTIMSKRDELWYLKEAVTKLSVLYNVPVTFGNPYMEIDGSLGLPVKPEDINLDWAGALDRLEKETEIKICLTW